MVVVEHDEETMRRADYMVDLGPGAGVHGGQVVAAGTLEGIIAASGIDYRQVPARAQEISDARDNDDRCPRLKRKVELARRLDAWLTLHDAAKNNLKNVTVKFPLGRLVVVTGVSGSGKSTLIRECLLPALQTRSAQNRTRRSRNPQTAIRISRLRNIQAVYEVDQSPIGRTPRSIPATYVGFFDEIRKLFAQVPEARLRGYSPSRFSFNSAQGRCPECEGAGRSSWK